MLPPIQEIPSYSQVADDDPASPVEAVEPHYPSTDVDASMTIVHEDEPNLAEQTLIQEDKEESPNRLSGSGYPVHSVADVEKRGDLKLPEEEEEDIVELKEEALASEIGKGSSPALNLRSRRTSHLRLELSAKESAVPWERVSPSQNGHVKPVNGYYSPTGSQQKLSTR